MLYYSSYETSRKTTTLFLCVDGRLRTRVDGCDELLAAVSIRRCPRRRRPVDVAARRASFQRMLLVFLGDR